MDYRPLPLPARYAPPVYAPPPQPAPPPPVVTVAHWPLTAIESADASIPQGTSCELLGWVRQLHASSGYLQRLAIRCDGTFVYPRGENGGVVAWDPPVRVGSTEDGALRYRYQPVQGSSDATLRRAELDPEHLEVRLVRDGEKRDVRFASTVWSEPERVLFPQESRVLPLAFDAPRHLRARVSGLAPQRRPRGLHRGDRCDIAVEPSTLPGRCFVSVRCGDRILARESDGALSCTVDDDTVEVHGPRIVVRDGRAVVHDFDGDVVPMRILAAR